MASPYTTTQGGLEQQVGVNHFAHFLLFELLKPLLLDTAKKDGTTSLVINLSSAGHRFSGLKFNNKEELDSWNEGKGFHKWEAYGQAKTANILMANAITRKYGDQNLHGLSVHPGGIVTELARHLSDEDMKMFEDPNIQKIFKSPSQGAATTVWAAVSPHFEGQNGGRYLEDVGESAPADENAGPVSGGYRPWAYDQEKEDLLWTVSCDVVGLPQS